MTVFMIKQEFKNYPCCNFNGLYQNFEDAEKEFYNFIKADGEIVQKEEYGWEENLYYHIVHTNNSIYYLIEEPVF